MRESAGDKGKSLLPEGSFGFLVYTLLLFGAIYAVQFLSMATEAHTVIIFLGILALWRYSWGLLHYARFLIYSRLYFPTLRKKIMAQDAPLPSHIYIVLTSFRIESLTSASVFKSTLQEAIACNIPATIVCSLVELSDEWLMKRIFQEMAPPASIRLALVRIPGTGKRDGLAQGFRAISRDFPAEDSVTIVLDGDSLMEPGLIRKCVPFFSNQRLGALTTDEKCVVYGSDITKAWHHLRFAQRQILMGSVALSRKVLTLTGRMSMFRTDIITNPDFIRQVEHDSIDHWRLGQFRFLTGDDKSSWFWVLKNRYEMLYVPDAVVITAEHPPSPHFIHSSTILMMRWFGNMLRTNGRALALGPRTTGFFTWWCLLDQRISMWTSLTGPVMAIIMALKYSISMVAFYAVWIGFTRWIMTLMLLSSRWSLNWTFPFLIYYNQVWGSLIKTYVFFHLDRQSWTRQKTSLNRNLSVFHRFWLGMSSNIVHGIALLVFVAFVGYLSGALEMPSHYAFLYP